MLRQQSLLQRTIAHAIQVLLWFVGRARLVQSATERNMSDESLTYEVKLQIARILYRMMVGKYPDRLVTLCDQKRVLARSDRPETMPPLSN